MTGRVYVVGTADTKGAELAYIRDLIRADGVAAVTADLSTLPHGGAADISAREIAGHHPGGTEAVFTGDRGTAVAAMAEAFQRFLASRNDVDGVIGIGGSGRFGCGRPAIAHPATQLSDAGARIDITTLGPIAIPQPSARTTASKPNRIPASAIFSPGAPSRRARRSPATPRQNATNPGNPPTDPTREVSSPIGPTTSASVA